VPIADTSPKWGKGPLCRPSCRINNNSGNGDEKPDLVTVPELISVVIGTFLICVGGQRMPACSARLFKSHNQSLAGS
jgi:hypothetical protein